MAQLTCPNCHGEIELTELMRSHVTAELRREMELNLAPQRSELNSARVQLAKDRELLEAARASISTEVDAQVAAQTKILEAKARKAASEALSVELHDRDARLRELQSQLAMARDAELQLRKRERELQNQKEQLEIQVARQLDVERAKIRDEARLQVEEQHQLKDAEKEKKIADLAEKVKEMQRKLDQGSQQVQGEIQELALEELLRDTFPSDAIVPIGKGVFGGDCVQQVHDQSGHCSGKILWESKRTKNWSNTWLAKARDDQRTARTECVVIVSEALPEGVRSFARIEGVWVCGWIYAHALASALRYGLIEVGKARLAAHGQHEVMELVYNYLASSEFQQRVGGIIEAVVSMKTDLDSEKRSTTRIWSKREKQIHRALTNTANLYGDLQGLIGPSLPTIEGLRTPRIAAKDYEDGGAA